MCVFYVSLFGDGEGPQPGNSHPAGWANDISAARCKAIPEMSVPQISIVNAFIFYELCNIRGFYL